MAIKLAVTDSAVNSTISDGKNWMQIGNRNKNIPIYDTRYSVSRIYEKTANVHAYHRDVFMNKGRALRCSPTRTVVLEKAIGKVEGDSISKRGSACIRLLSPP